jgi:O-antigen/teichoic acid export membrane protein
VYDINLPYCKVAFVKKNSTLFDVSTTFGTRLLVLVGNFIVSIITARLLGPEGKGLYAAISVIPGLVLAFSDFGIGHSAAYLVGRKIHRQEDIASSLLLLWILTSIFAVCVAAIFYAFQFGSEYWLLLLIMLLVIPCDLGIRYMKGFLQGKERISAMNKLDVYRVLLNIACTLLLVAGLRLGVMGMVLTTFTISLAACILSTFYAGKEVRLKLRILKPISMQLFSRGIAFAAAILILQLNLRIDLVMLESMSTIYEVGIYSLGTNVSELIWQIPTAVGMVLFARSANSKTANEAVQRTARMIRMLVPVLFVFGIVFWGIMPIFVNLLYGKAYSDSIPVIRLLLPGIILMVIVKLLHSDLSGRGKPLLSMLLAIPSLIVNVAANWYLIPRYGAEGAAISSSISYSLACFLFIIVYAYSERISLRELLMIRGADISDIRRQIRKPGLVRKSTG